MARGWKPGILVLLILCAPITVGYAQVSKGRKPQGASLASRLGQLKNAFLGDNKSEEEFEPPSPEDYSHESNERSAPLPGRRSAQGRVQPGDILPKGIFFDRNTSQRVSHDDLEAGDEVFGASRRGSAVSSAATGQTPRKSPSTTRENELQSALDDIRAVKDDQLSGAGETAAAPVIPSPSQNQTPSTQGDTQGFDLRQAMINKASGGANAARSEALDELRRQLMSLDTKTQTDVQTTESLTAPFEQPVEDIFAKPTQQPVAERRTPPVENSRSGMLTAGGETLLSTQQPVIQSRVEGPRQILVGREATYRVTLENTSDSDAHALTAEVSIPDWAEVVDVITSSGVIEREEISGPTLRWQLQDLAARSTQSLAVRLIPRSGKPLQLSVKWSQAPVASEAVVEVQEPKLEMKISGPQEVLFNKPQRFQLSLRNPGTGVAENVVIRLIPPGGDEQSASTHTIGTLAAGSKKEIELELTAREAGELIMKASATAAGGLQSEAVRNVLCRKPELELDWRGPAEKYAGTEASYYFRVRNTGTANTDPVAMRVKLPEGIKLVSASEGYKLDPQNREITWQVETIPAGEAEFMQICCQIERPGANRFEAIAETAKGDLKSTQEIETNVIAVADLKLTVSDPKGPVPVGETAIYEIRIRNRGTTDAQNVGVVGLFSAGIDPNAVEGAQFSVRDGRVSIHPINTLPAGQELVLKIRAVAAQAGTHVFRAEVTCQDLDIKLAAEETTKFYEDQYRWEDGETAYSSDPNSVGTR